MRELPYDWARCIPQEKGCENKAKCARFTSRHRVDWQSAIDASNHIVDDICPLFIDNEKDN